MSQTYLEVPFRQKDEAKALGARWDANARKWYVPEGRELGPFNAWLPPSVRSGASVTAPAADLIPVADAAGQDVTLHKKGISLSQLLAGVAQAVAQAFKAGVWTIVEVVEARTKNGHVYLELSERTRNGSVLATARATLWANTANKILPQFERTTGASIAPGIKLLVRARPVYKPQYGFNLEIDAIDPEYTLGDLEAKKREIRTRLQQEGVFDANKKLPPPWDFNTVLVVAPQGAAGLGDFQAEAKRLEYFGICRFIYAFSRFQGEGVPREIREALLDALMHWSDSGMPEPYAVVIIRGGGAANDLAWLNDYELARTLCTLKIPVLTGIGHERDNTILDEVANIRYDTPSKVVAGIEQVIKKRVEEAKVNFAFLTSESLRAVNAANVQIEKGLSGIESAARRQVAAARQSATALITELQLDATKTVHDAKQEAQNLVTGVRHDAHQLLFIAKREVPTMLSEIKVEAANVIRTAHMLAKNRLEAIRERATVDVVRSRESVERGLQDVAASARRVIGNARSTATALVREVAGQGPEKTLGRGFAIVRDEHGRPLTSAAGAKPGAGVEIEFRDGRVAAQVK